MFILIATLSIAINPHISGITLTSSSGTNTTTENLTVAVANDATTFRNIMNWKLNGDTIAVLNMPFDINNSAGTGATKDYSGFGHTGTLKNTTRYCATCGWNGTGAMVLDGIGDYINITQTDAFNFSNRSGFTVMAWIKPATLVNGDAEVITQYFTTNGRVWRLQINSSGPGNSIARFIGCSNAGDTNSCQFAIGVTPITPDNWYHLTGRWNTTNLQIFVNGLPDDSTPPPLTNMTYTTTKTIRIGLDVSSEDYNGTIDEIYIFNRSLTDEQILAFAKNQTDLIVSQETTLNDVWQACATAINDTTEGDTNCTDLTIITSAANELPIITQNSLNPTAPNTLDNLNCSFIITDANAGDPLSANVTWYNNSIIAASYNISVTNGTQTSNSLSAQNTTRFENWSCSVLPYDGTDNGISANASTIIVNAAPNQTMPILNSTLGTNTTSENLTIYNQSTTDLENDPITNIIDWKIWNNTAMESIMVLNMPFDTNYSQHNKTSTIKDYSTYKKNGTGGDGNSSQTPRWTNNGKIGGSYRFDGVDDWINVPYSDSFNFSQSGAFTVSAWVKPGLLTDSDGDIVSQYTITNNNRIWTLQINNNVTRFIACSNGSLSSCVYATGTTILNENQWYFVSGRWNGTAIDVYVNGEEEDAGLDAITQLHSSTSVAIRIGINVASSYFNGTVDNLRIYNRSMQQQQISAIYQDEALNKSSRTITSQQLTVNDIWQSCITPNDGFNDGEELCSRNLTILMGNIAPSITEINITPQSANQSFNLSCNFIVTDQNPGDSLSANVTWINNSDNYKSYVITIVNNEVTSNELMSANTSHGQSWACSVTPYDGIVYGSTTNTSVLISNEAPTQTKPLLNSTSGTNTTSADLFAYNQSTTDTENDPVNNIYNWYINNQSTTILNMPMDTNIASFGQDLIKDYSDSGNNGTLGNGNISRTPVWTTSGIKGGAYVFDGIDDSIIIQYDPTLNLQAPFTIEAWVNVKTVDSANTWTRIVSKYRPTTENRSFILGLNGSANPRFTICPEGILDTCKYATSPSAISLNQWHYLVATYDQNYMKLYVDGVIADQIATAISLYNINETLSIGASQFAESPFNGTIDEVRIYNLTITEGQVKAIYNSGNPTYNRINHTQTQSLQNWSVSITPNDGNTDGTSLMSDQLKILNNVPSPSNSFIYPEPINVNKNLYGYSENFSDNDGDMESPGMYKWYRNDTLIDQGVSSQLFLLHFDYGDGVSFTANTSDNELPLNNSGLQNFTGVFGKDLYINTGDRLIYSKENNINKSAGTILFWVQPDWNPETETNQRPFFEDRNNQMYLFFDPDNDNINVNITINSTTTVSVGTGNLTGILTDDLWTHVAVMWNQSTGLIQIYIDGSLYANNTQDIYWDSNYPNLGDLFIGTNTGTRTAASHLDEFAIYNKPIPQAHVQDIINSTQPIHWQEVFLAKSNLFGSSNITYSYAPFDGFEYGNFTNYTLTVPISTINNSAYNITKSIIGADGVVQIASNWTTNFTLESAWLEVDEGANKFNTTEKTFGIYLDDTSYFDWVNDFRTTKRDAVDVTSTIDGYIMYGINVTFNFTDNVATDYVYVRKYINPINVSKYNAITYYAKADDGRKVQTRIALYNTSNDGTMSACDYPIYPDIMTTKWEQFSLNISNYSAGCDLGNISLIKFTANDINNSDAFSGSVLLDEIYLTQTAGFNDSQIIFNYKPLSPLTAGQTLRVRVNARDNTGYYTSTPWFNLSVDNDKPQLQFNLENNYSHIYSEIRINGTFNDTTTPSSFWIEINSSIGRYNLSIRPIGHYIDNFDNPNWVYASGTVKGPDVNLTRDINGYNGYGLNVNYNYSKTTTDYFFLEHGIDPVALANFDSLYFKAKADLPRFHQLRMDLWCEDERPPESFRITPKQNLIETDNWETMEFKSEEYYTDTPECVAENYNMSRMKLEIGDYNDTFVGIGTIRLDEIYFGKRDKPERNVGQVPFRFAWTNFNETGNFSLRIYFNDSSGNLNVSEWVSIIQGNFSRPDSDNIIQDNGSIIDQVTSWRDNALLMNYIPPSYEERQRFKNETLRLVQSIYPPNNFNYRPIQLNVTLLQDIAGKFQDFDYELVNFSDNVTGYNYILLREKNDTIVKGWGAFIFNYNTNSTIIIETPHIIWDINASITGNMIFVEMFPKAQVISTSHRYAVRNHDSDAGHSFNTMFAPVHEALIENTTNPVVVQIHGFTSSLLANKFQVIIADAIGLTKTLELQSVESKYRDMGFSTCVWNYNCTYFSATNEASAHNTYRVGGQFIHIELNTSLRTDYALSRQVIDAMIRFREWLPPNITLTSPANNAVYPLGTNLTISCAATDTMNVTNITLYLTNDDTLNANSSSTFVNINDTNLSKSYVLGSGNYTWNCMARDSNSNERFAFENFTFTISTPINPSSILISPANNTILSARNASFVCNATDDSISNVSLYTNTNGSWSINATQVLTGTINQSNFTVKDITDGIYNWNCLVKDTDNNQVFNSTNYTITVDTTAPLNVGLISPLEGYSSTDTLVVFNFSATDNLDTNLTCNLTIDGLPVATINVSNGISRTTSNSRSVGNHQWNVTCYDNALNSNTSITRNFSITSTQTTTPVASNGGGGGSASLSKKIQNYTIDKDKIETEIMQGETRTESFVIDNNGDTDLTFNIKVENIADYVYFKTTSFQLKPKTSKIIYLNLIAPIDLKPQLYKGSIVIESQSIEKTILVLMNVIKKEAQFDVKVEIPVQFSNVFPGDEVNANIQVVNVRKVSKVDIGVHYFITNNNGEVITQASDIASVLDISTFLRKLKLPDNLIPGDYQFNVNITYKDISMQSKAPFKVSSIRESKLNYPLQPYLKATVLFLSTAFIITIIILLRPTFKKIIGLKYRKKKYKKL